jgi:hypothetical protein
MGAAMVRAMRAGIIERTDRTEPTDRPEAHRSPKRIWRSVILTGEAKAAENDRVRGLRLVNGPVTAEVGEVSLRLFAPDDAPRPFDSWSPMPWAWGALCRVKFTIGELVTSKRVVVKYQYPLDQQDRPDADALGTGRAAVLADLRTMLRRHGFEPPELIVLDPVGEGQ